ncbi:C-C motif chemokine 13-like [Labrus mixtus]|uniref:C-C motif chemokine 13-like n=1 Tax=Labrus mixtus TaxID=508554 RepID=UPI0029C06C63|nr:C-C motif chemokine 13-like [Labrus mixtus]
MKTLRIILGLLLLCACCCTAMPEGLRSTAPAKCCFKFSEKQVAEIRVRTITKTDVSCPHKAFLVETIRGKEMCFKHSFEYAKELYNRRHNNNKEGSSQ